MDRCPFFPNDISPCDIRMCSFRCTGGCAIMLAAHSYDTLQEVKRIKQDISSKLNNIEYDIQQIKQKVR